MAGIRWGKLSGKNRGGTCNGGKGRKCEKPEGKESAKCKEGEGLKNRVLLRSRCMKASVIDGVLIEIKSNPHPNSKSSPEEGMMMKIDSCEIKGKPLPNGNILHKEGVIKKGGLCEKSFDASLNKIQSKSNLNNKSLGVLKKFDSSEKGVDAECREKLADGSIKCKGDWGVKQGTWDNQCMENVKQVTCNNECMDDVKQFTCNNECMDDVEKGKPDSECGEHTTQDNEYVKQGIWNMKQGIPNSGFDKPGNADCMKVLVHDKAGDADCIALTHSNVSTGLDTKSLKDVQRKACNAEVDKKKDNLIYEKSLSEDSELVMVPHDFVCGISKKVMEDPVVIASGQTFERACIQAWLDEGNTICPITGECLSHLQLIPNLTLKALISSWYSQSHVLADVDSVHQSFSSCISSFSSCPSLMTPQHQSFVSCSSFSVSNLLEETELYSSSSSSSSSLPKLLRGAELYSFSSSSVSVPSYDNPEHLRAAGIHNFPSPSSTGSPSSSTWEQERVVFSLQEDGLQSVKSMHKRRGQDELVMSKTSQRCNSHSKSNDSMSAKPCTYIVSRINSLVSDLKSEYLDIQRSAAAELRLLAKHDDSNRLMIASAGALRSLVALQWSTDEFIQLEATTALLNLSLNHSLKDSIVKEGAIEALVSVLRDGFSTVAKENAAVTLACLATSEENKSKIGLASAVEPLVNLLERGSPRGRKDAATALYRLSSNDENKRRVVRAGALRLLVYFISNEGDKDGMVEKAIAILRNLVSIEEGRVAFVEEGGILCLMQVLRTASIRTKGFAVSILFQVCTHSSKHRALVLQKDPLPTLMELSRTGNTCLKTQVAEVIQLLIVDAFTS